MKVIGTVGTTENENAVKQAGASLVFNHRQNGYVQQIPVGVTACTGKYKYKAAINGNLKVPITLKCLFC